MTPTEPKNHLEWLQHLDIRELLAKDGPLTPWFPACRHEKCNGAEITWFSALVPIKLVPKLLKQPGEWDLRIGEGGPSIWSCYKNGKETESYVANGNEKGIEPLVIHRSFHGLRGPFHELSQEFRLYHNLYPVPTKQYFIHIDENGDESVAARYGDNFLDIRTDLLMEFCAIKKVALAVYVDSSRHSKRSLTDLKVESSQVYHNGERHGYYFGMIKRDQIFDNEFETAATIIGKKYILPKAASGDSRKKEAYQEFIIGKDEAGNPMRHTSNPEKLGNYFGKNPQAPHYLTPVFFRADVLAKYYADPSKYSVEDGYLRCGSLWGLKMDNDHVDFVVVFLGDLGRDLLEAERTYWLSFNIAPEGRTISKTTFRRGFLAEFADPERPDLVFKSEYDVFNRKFREVANWDFFLPLHDHDKHFLTTLRLLTKDNQAEFDLQLIAFTKVLIDSLNEKEIKSRLSTATENDKGITKLEKFLCEYCKVGYDKHIKFLRGLQDLRSKSAAHRKGSSYDALTEELHISDGGQQKVFAELLDSGIEFMRYLRLIMLPKLTPIS
ncbi:MAG TPA: hypothetical protein VGO67_03445 [Verrucomicrobiae bacterium]